MIQTYPSDRQALQGSVASQLRQNMDWRPDLITLILLGLKRLSLAHIVPPRAAHPVTPEGGGCSLMGWGHRDEGHEQPGQNQHEQHLPLPISLWKELSSQSRLGDGPEEDLQNQLSPG